MAEGGPRRFSRAQYEFCPSCPSQKIPHTWRGCHEGIFEWSVSSFPDRSHGTPTIEAQWAPMMRSGSLTVTSRWQPPGHRTTITW